MVDVIEKLTPFNKTIMILKIWSAILDPPFEFNFIF